jgi:putative oxygen-independent coproporphyrinogen III oxidase
MSRRPDVEAERCELRAPPLSLYVHLPWCVRKCPYCDFSSYVRSSQGVPEALYVKALLQDLDEELPRVQGRSIDTIFLGGGTPSLFGPESLATLLAGVRARVAVAPNAEITMEANPGTLECGRFAGYRAAGINRVSLGAQSFSSAALAALGRIHGPQDTLAAITELKTAGLANFNLDLMHGLPGQSGEGALEDVLTALRTDAPHVSYYQLTLEPGTPFARHPPALPDEDELEERERLAQAELARAGYARYEISALARPGAECRHNRNYWEYGDYLGIGAGAHGKCTHESRQTIERSEKLRNPDAYLRAAHEARALGTRIAVAERERPFEFMLNALRLARGCTAQEFEARTGLAFVGVAATVDRLAERRLLRLEEGRIAPTAQGWRFLNDLQAEFLPEWPAQRADASVAGPSHA